MTSSPVFCKCSYISPSYFTPFHQSFLSSHRLLNKVKCTSTWFMVWFQLRLSYKCPDFPAPSFDVWPTVHCHITSIDVQLDAQNSLLFLKSCLYLTVLCTGEST